MTDYTDASLDSLANHEVMVGSDLRPIERTPIPCPECGCTQWFDIVIGRETERIDFNSETGYEISDSLEYDIDASDGWACADNEHYADDATSALIEEAR
jgi:hypothetical protein